MPIEAGRRRDAPPRPHTRHRNRRAHRSCDPAPPVAPRPGAGRALRAQRRPGTGGQPHPAAILGVRSRHARHGPARRCRALLRRRPGSHLARPQPAGRRRRARSPGGRRGTHRTRRGRHGARPRQPHDPRALPRGGSTPACRRTRRRAGAPRRGPRIARSGARSVRRVAGGDPDRAVGPHPHRHADDHARPGGRVAHGARRRRADRRVLARTERPRRWRIARGIRRIERRRRLGRGGGDRTRRPGRGGRDLRPSGRAGRSRRVDPTRRRHDHPGAARVHDRAHPCRRRPTS